jgi:hypothetical protein
MLLLLVVTIIITLVAVLNAWRAIFDAWRASVTQVPRAFEVLVQGLGVNCAWYILCSAVFVGVSAWRVEITWCISIGVGAYFVGVDIGGGVTWPWW